jgi:hypothetical protein
LTDPVIDFGAEKITAGMFRDHLDSDFLVAVEGREVSLRLVDVTDPETRGGFERFSLTFEGSSGALLPDGLHTFHHHALGWFVIFIVPVFGSNAERIVYGASFNRHSPR